MDRGVGGGQVSVREGAEPGVGTRGRERQAGDAGEDLGGEDFGSVGVQVAEGFASADAGDAGLGVGDMDEPRVFEGMGAVDHF